MNSNGSQILNPVNSTGTHILAEYSNCDPAVIADCAAIEEILAKAALAAGATIVARKTHRCDSGEIISLVVLQESHLSVHTWPDKGYAAADFFTCGNCVAHNAHPVMEQSLGATSSQIVVLERGLPGPKKMRVLGHRAIEQVIVDCSADSLPDTLSVCESPGRGLGLFSTRSFQPGELIYETTMWLASFDTEFVMQSSVGESTLTADELGSELTLSEIDTFPDHIRQSILTHYKLDLETTTSAVLRDSLTGGGKREVLVTSFDGLMNHSSQPNITVDPEVKSVAFDTGEPIWTIRILAGTPIEAGDELFWDYSDASGFIPPDSWLS